MKLKKESKTKILSRRYLTTGDISKISNVTSQTVINWIDSGKLPHMRIEKGRRLVSKNDFLEFMKKNKLRYDKLNPKVIKKLEQEDTSFIDRVTIFAIKKIKTLKKTQYGYINKDKKLLEQLTIIVDLENEQARCKILKK